MKHRTVFRRIMLLIICLFVPILGVYTYSNYQMQANLTDRIEAQNMSHAEFFVSQVEARLERLKQNAAFLTQDKDVRQLIHYDLLSEWERLQLKNELLEKLMYLNNNNDWNDWLAVLSPRNQMRIYTNFSDTNVDIYSGTLKAIPGWQVEETLVGPMNKEFFIWNITYPYSSQNEDYSPLLVVQVGISVDTLTDMLKQFKNERQGEIFLYTPGQPVIMDGQLPEETLELWENYYASHSFAETGSSTMEINNIAYLVNFVHSEVLGWNLVTMSPQQEIYAPIKRGQVIFYVLLILLLIFAIGAGYLIFRHVQFPMMQMLSGVRRFEKGEYSVRLEIGKAHDFVYLFKSFNRMAGTIQELIEKVYLEQIRSREAKLKQLQSQINPHFLYNSLYFVESMIHLDQRQAASDMVMNLAQYFRYATYVDKRTASLEEELNVVESYLRIHKLRNKRFDYHIEVHEGLLNLQVPRLILQPIVENAIIYGLEGKEGKGTVRIGSSVGGEGWQLFVDDDGFGIQEDKRKQLDVEWATSLVHSSESCGMNNVNQRLKLLYGEGAGLEISTSPDGGCRIILKLGTIIPEGG
ncbi:histidine kinase [Paenibacillus sp. LHD-38]|uniref:sensor histidine kinase n=1 Tax=Paenibacillus sp. LHD-38 TaxID=3072143 RepID=UPI00280FD1A5|nr:histidine kinase [Paenibacillus sp. LHD-38]MDQ8734755.1 histidine kinase [Paenibacillus sp. LHD-38]